jgi:hypothetical protein
MEAYIHCQNVYLNTMKWGGEVTPAIKHPLKDTSPPFFVCHIFCTLIN